MEIYRIKGQSRAEKLDPAHWEGQGNFFRNTDETLLIFLTHERFSEIRGSLNYPAKAVMESLDSNQFPNIEFYDDMLFLTLNYITPETEFNENLIAKEINLFFSRNRLLVVYHGELTDLDASIARIDHTSIATALYTFIDSLLEIDKRIIIRLNQAAEDLEDQILEGVVVDDKKRKNHPSDGQDPDFYMTQIVSLRKEMQLLMSYIEPTQDVLEILENEAGRFIENGSGKYFKKLSMKADRLVDYVDNLRDTISEVRSSWQSQVDLTFNKIAKLFTVITAVFSPLTLIVGWFGMNFVAMPGLDHPLGYPSVALLSFIIFVLSIWWFKKNRYI